MEALESDERSALLPNSEGGIGEPVYESISREASSTNSQPRDHTRPSSPAEETSSLAIWIVIPISLIGVFIASADGSLVVASSQQIASEFDALFNAQWLVTSYLLAQCASQSLYGKLSDIFGRKMNLTAAYIFFAVGCFLCGSGQQYWQVVTGRAISGIGAAGMTALVSVIISDMVPVRDIATWRSYVNIAATTGRSLGGPVGGWLCDTVGWRWCFYAQVPFSIIGLAMILWKMPKITVKSQHLKSLENQTLSQRWRRVDLLGAACLSSAIITFLLLLDAIAQEYSPLRLVIMSALLVLFTTAFLTTERYFAKEPILPLHLLLSRPALTSYLLIGFQFAAQFAMFYSVPIYFQLTSNSTVAQAGFHLVPTVIGNAVAGLLSGRIISKTGRYKLFTISSVAFAVAGYALITVRWRGRPDLHWSETLYVFAGGFGSGATQSTTFVHLAASISAEEIAIAGTTLYLAGNLFLMVGVQTSTTVCHVALRRILDVRLRGIGLGGGREQRVAVIEKAVSSVHAIKKLPDHLRRVVVGGYIDALTLTFGTSIVWAVLGLLVALSMQERRLD